MNRVREGVSDSERSEKGNHDLVYSVSLTFPTFFKEKKKFV